MNEQQLREEFQNFADSIIWSNDDGSEKYIGVGNMADWWIKKITVPICNLCNKKDSMDDTLGVL